MAAQTWPCGAGVDWSDGVVIKLYGNLRMLAGSKQLELPGDTVQVLLENLCAHSSQLGEAVLSQGILRRYVRVMVNGHDIELAQGLATPLNPGDQVSIFPPIAGG